MGEKMSRVHFNGASKAENIAARAGHVSGKIMGRVVNAAEMGMDAFEAAGLGQISNFLVRAAQAIKATVKIMPTVGTAPMQVQPSEFRMQAEAKGLAKGGRGVASAFKRANKEAYEQERTKPRMAAKAPLLKPA